MFLKVFCHFLVVIIVFSTSGSGIRTHNLAIFEREAKMRPLVRTVFLFYFI